MNFKMFSQIAIVLLLFYQQAGLAQNEDTWDANNFNPNVAYGNIVIDDTEITSDVKQALKPLSYSTIKVSSLQGIVSLTGHVNSPAEASLLIRRTERVKGVHGVDASGLNLQ